jgi:hypothetical protein
MQKSVNFQKLVGETASLYYCNEMNTFQLGSVLFEVEADEDDGYRSYLQDVHILKTDAPKIQLLGVVEITESSIDGYELRDREDGFVWLQFGTDNSDSYYPCFVFNTYARPPIEEEIKKLIK